MITLTWYNIVAIVVGIIFLISFARTCISENETGFLGGLGSALEGFFIIFITALFYAIWGGIFWW